ncbi:MAG: rod shape-determining protein MreC [Candidatus Saelkia tenebricola]|nr:rod shape-determining protein MreC [Candidatus Saelkia tenebricola]
MKRGLILVCLFLLLYFVKGFLYDVILNISGHVFSNPVVQLAIPRKFVTTDNMEHGSENNKIQISRIKELEKEIERLQDILGFKKKFRKSCVARIIGRDQEEILNQLIIDAGIQEGVSRNSAVLTPIGLIGVVERVNKGFSSVLPYSDPRFNVSVRIVSTREIGLLVGGIEKGNLKLLYLSLDTDAKIGDVISTSGEGILPKGLLIGKIVDIFMHPSQLYKIANICPFVDLRKTEEVLVLIEE